jgi:hypothetical protein
MYGLNLVSASNGLGNSALLHPWQKQLAHIKRHQFFLDVLVREVVV